MYSIKIMGTFRLFFLLCIWFVGCTNTDIFSPKKKEKESPEVLCTIAMISDLVSFIGKPYIQVHSLIPHGLDPHSYQLLKGDNEKLASAQIIFFNGLGLEHGTSLFHYLKNQKNSIGLGNILYEQEPDLILFSHRLPDPHIWLDVSIWAKTVPIITKALSQTFPEHKEYFKKNARVLIKKLESLHYKITKLLHDIPEPRRYLITSHNAFNYFTRAYLSHKEELNDNRLWQKRFIAPEGISPASQINSADIQKILDHIEKYQISTIFWEVNVSKDSLYKVLEVAETRGLQLTIAGEPLYGDAMGGPNTKGNNYFMMMQSNALVLYKYLNKNLKDPS